MLETFQKLFNGALRIFLTSKQEFRNWYIQYLATNLLSHHLQCMISLDMCCEFREMKPFSEYISFLVISPKKILVCPTFNKCQPDNEIMSSLSAISRVGILKYLQWGEKPPSIGSLMHGSYSCKRWNAQI